MGLNWQALGGRKLPGVGSIYPEEGRDMTRLPLPGKCQALFGNFGESNRGFDGMEGRVMLGLGTPVDTMEVGGSAWHTIIPHNMHNQGHSRAKHTKQRYGIDRSKNSPGFFCIVGILTAI